MLFFRSVMPFYFHIVINEFICNVFCARACSAFSGEFTISTTVSPSFLLASACTGKMFSTFTRPLAVLCLVLQRRGNGTNVEVGEGGVFVVDHLVTVDWVE
jgi:hypothetical protein